MEVAARRNQSNAPLISLLLHTDSLSGEIEDPDSPLSALLELGPIPHVQMVYTMPASRRTLEHLKNKMANLAIVKDGLDALVIRGDGFEKAMRPGPRERRGREIAEGSPVRRLDHLATRDFDYLVVGSHDPIREDRPKGVRLVSPEEALSMVRVVLVNCGVFVVSGNRRTSEWLYYVCRSKMLFPEAWSAWSIAVRNKDKGLPAGVYEQLCSLQQRLDFICRASDKASFYALNRPSNDSGANILYHLAYLVILATGVFDDLAWISTRQYSFRLHRTKVSLRIPEKRKTPALYELLSNVNPRLHEYLAKPDTQATINLFYPIRDVLQHREFIGSLLYVNRGEGLAAIHIDIPEASMKLAKALSQDGTGREWGVVQSGDTHRLDPFVFSHMAVSSVAAIVNQVLRLLGLGRSLPESPIRRTTSCPTAHPYL